MRHTLAIDFGSRYIGIALVQHPAPLQNRVAYAATIVVDAKPLNALVENRAMVRHMRRSRKTHRRRLRQLAQSLQGIPSMEAIVQFCRRRGYSHLEPSEKNSETANFQVPRSKFFELLRQEIDRVIGPKDREKVWTACRRHLNEACVRTAEIRPARFENRGRSRCAWSACQRNVPRAGNDLQGRLSQALFAWMLPVFKDSPAPDRLRRSLDYWINRLAHLSVSLRDVKDKEARKPLDAQIKKVFKSLLAGVDREAKPESAAKFQEDWKEYYRKNLSDILRKEQSGRVRFCRIHSREFVDHLLAGKQVPVEQQITEGDLMSRKQQIVFRRIWRLVESRLLPLAGGKIERVIAERVAFDVLKGPWKERQAVSETKASEIYWNGPQFGFANRLDMLKEEFGNRCAYCGQVGAVEQVEHWMPRSAFPFDSYFNILPACTPCNHKKGPRTALEAAMTIAPEAYEAYGDYIRKRKTPHVFHFLKKGLLKLFQQSGEAARAERRLAMLANDLVTITTSQQSPRPLARYLATQLAKRTGLRPEAGYRAGRHTALYRSIVLPDFDKQERREELDLRQHAVDAIILGCDLPSASALENKEWNTTAGAIRQWFDKVRQAGPEVLADLPKVEPVQGIPFFEEDLGSGYFSIDLSAFNWNRKRKATHALDPYGATAQGLPLKRKPASKVLAELVHEKTRAAAIDSIAHVGLRGLLQKPPESAAANFVRWLQQTTQAGLRNGQMGRHPADLARYELLTAFAESPIEKVVAGEIQIPPTVGVRCLNRGSQGKIEVKRVDRGGQVFQHYQSEPAVRELVVGYRMKNGELERSKPVIFVINQIHQVKRQKGSVRIPLELAADSPLMGRSHGVRGPWADFHARWKAAFKEFCAAEGLAQVFHITQGCVIEKMDGTVFQLRNFDKSGNWMKAGSFKEIRRVFRSPLQTMEKKLPPCEA